MIITLTLSDFYLRFAAFTAFVCWTIFAEEPTERRMTRGWRFSGAIIAGALWFLVLPFMLVLFVYAGWLEFKNALSEAKKKKREETDVAGT